MIRRIDESFSIKQKFIFLYTFIFFIPMIVMCIIIYSNIYVNNLDKFKAENLETFERINQLTDDHLAGIEIMGSDIFYNYKITNIITKPAEYKYSEKEDLDTFTWLTDALVTSRNGVSLKFYVQDKKIYARTKESVFPISELDERQNIDIVEYMNDDVFKWLPYNSEEDAFVYAVNINRKDADNNGYAIIYTKLDNIRKIISDQNNYAGTSYFIFDKNGNIIDDINGIFAEGINLSISEYISSDDKSTRSLDNVSLNGTDYQMLIKYKQNIQAYIVSLTQSSVIIKGVVKNLMFVLGLIVLSFVICIVLAYVLSTRITKNLGLLTKRMAKAHEELLHSETLPISEVKDESLQLQNEFQAMIERMKELIDRSYSQQIENQQVQMNMMQMQINPHFLYNILDSINWMAIKKDLPEISELVTNLATYYRLGLSGGDNMVSVESELKHVELYIKLQKIRFAQSIDVEYIVAPSAKELKTIKNILQPIVENAIYHGVVKKNILQGRIIIKVYSEEDTLFIEVWDNGGGIDVDEFNYLKKNKPEHDNKGFALYNVHNRILLACGDT